MGLKIKEQKEIYKKITLINFGTLSFYWKMINLH